MSTVKQWQQVATKGIQIERELRIELAKKDAEIERLEAALREARQYVSDAGDDEDPETQRLSGDLCAAIDAALEGKK